MKLPKIKTIKDRAFYQAIGRKGGNRTKVNKLAEDPEYYSKIGEMGGHAMKRTYGENFYSAIGRIKKEAQ